MHALNAQEMLELNRALSFAASQSGTNDIEEQELRKIRKNVQRYVAERNQAGFAVSEIIQNYVDGLE